MSSTLQVHPVAAAAGGLSVVALAAGPVAVENIGTAAAA